MQKLILSLLLVSCAHTMMGQTPKPSIHPHKQKTTIDAIVHHLKTKYVFPEVANQIGIHLNDRFKDDAYASLQDPELFAEAVTRDLYSISQDLHLRVLYAPDQITAQKNADALQDQEAMEQQWREQLKRENFGFREAKVLPGNIGYLKLNQFSPTQFGGETAVAAMRFLSNTDAIIIDLRQNGGGTPEMIQLIASYLFAPNLVQLSGIYWRPEDTTVQSWTLPHIQGKRMPATDVYILTSNRTFSAAEAFAYDLKNLERATLVGETTGGGANPGGTFPVTDQYLVFIPTGRAINPITGTNWEGIGVAPHIEVPAYEALERAHIEALTKLREKSKDSTLSEFYDWHIEGINARTKAFPIDMATLKQYVGNYGPRSISMEGKQLFYQLEGQQKYPLIPIGDRLFAVEGLSEFRVEFQLKNAEVVALIGRYDDGWAEMTPKD